MIQLPLTEEELKAVCAALWNGHADMAKKLQSATQRKQQEFYAGRMKHYEVLLDKCNKVLAGAHEPELYPHAHGEG